MASGRSHMLPCLRLYGSTPDEALPVIAATTQHSVTFVASDDATTWLTMSKTLHGLSICLFFFIERARTSRKTSVRNMTAMWRFPAAPHNVPAPLQSRWRTRCHAAHMFPM